MGGDMVGQQPPTRLFYLHRQAVLAEETRSVLEACFAPVVRAWAACAEMVLDAVCPVGVGVLDERFLHLFALAWKRGFLAPCAIRELGFFLNTELAQRVIDLRVCLAEAGGDRREAINRIARERRGLILPALRRDGTRPVLIGGVDEEGRILLSDPEQTCGLFLELGQFELLCSGRQAPGVPANFGRIGWDSERLLLIGSA